MFKAMQMGTINYIQCPGKIDRDTVEDGVNKIPNWSEMEVSAHVLDFKETQALHPNFFRFIGQFNKSLKPYNRKIISIHVRDGLIESIERSGMDVVMNIISDLSKLTEKKEVPTDLKKIKELMLIYFTNSAKLTLEVMFKTSLSVDDKNIQRIKQLSLQDFDGVAHLSSANEFLQLAVRLCFKKEHLRQLTAAMLSTQSSEIVDETLKSTGTEMLNVMYGRAKSSLNDDEGFELLPAIPSFAWREEFSRLKQQPDSQTHRIPLTTPLGNIYLEIEMKL